MISPGFFSLFNAHRGLIAAQMALDTVNHNISNANTPGYSRQRVDLSAFTPYTHPSNMFQDLSSGQMGQGVQVDGVTRIRDEFIDGQFRLQNAVFGFNTDIRNVLQQMEGILAEPSDAGINTSMNAFFDAAQELSINPESIAVRQDFLQHGQDLITVFQQQGEQLQTLQRQLVGEIGIPGSFGISALSINVEDANNKIREIANLNQEILTVQASGASPNDLLDRRDLLLDELSKLVEIEVTELAQGQITVSIADQTMIQGVRLVDTLQVVPNDGAIVPVTGNPDHEPSLVLTVNGNALGPVDIINGTNQLPGQNPIQFGQIRGIVEVAGRSTTQTTVRGALEDLAALLDEIAAQINFLQQTGFDLNGNAPIATDNIFELTAGVGLNIFRYQIDQDLINDPALIAAAETGGPGFEGDGENALSMAQLRDFPNVALGQTSYVEFFNGIISSLGIDTRTFENRGDAQEAVISSLDLRRQSISGVNMDEELIDLVKFQRAFEASSRTIQTFNEIYQTIINMV